MCYTDHWKVPVIRCWSCITVSQCLATIRIKFCLQFFKYMIPADDCIWFYHHTIATVYHINKCTHKFHSFFTVLSMPSLSSSISTPAMCKNHVQSLLNVTMFLDFWSMRIVIWWKFTTHICWSRHYIYTWVFLKYTLRQ